METTSDRADSPGTDRLRAGRLEPARSMGLDMIGRLVWRTILFFGLTAGYTALAALAYVG